MLLVLERQKGRTRRTGTKRSTRRPRQRLLHVHRRQECNAPPSPAGKVLAAHLLLSFLFRNVLVALRMVLRTFVRQQATSFEPPSCLRPKRRSIILPNFDGMTFCAYQGRRSRYYCHRSDQIDLGGWNAGAWHPFRRKKSHQQGRTAARSFF